jgi:D-sedoheptulose 7-phosphate isomerase
VPAGSNIIAFMLEQRIQQQFFDSADLKYAAAETLTRPIAEAVQLILNSITNGGKILACGNGGSAGDAQHFAAELVGRFEQERPGLAAISLVTDSSILTALSNDYSYEQVFAKQVHALGHPGDVLLAISTSGNSPNVMAAIEAAHAKDMAVVALTGKGGGAMRQALRPSDVHICVPHQRTARIQEVHLLVIHCLCDGLDALLLGTPDA